MSAPAAALRPAASLRRRQLIVILLLFGGYAACYFCRADLSVSEPLLVDELARHGVPRDAAVVHLGTIASLGVLAYAFGKLFLTGLGDFWGGRLNFLIGLAGAAVFTALFAASGTIPIFTLAWIGNRLTQSVAWAGLIKTSSRWFDYSSYGTIIGVLSISYLVGDALARWAMGLLIAHGFGWRLIFYFAASVAGVLLALNHLFLRESRTELGFREARTNPLNLFSDCSARPASLRALLGPLFRSRAFQLVCLLSLGCTIVRETFNLWTPAYLQGYLGYATASAATTSAVFPAVGAVSVLATGWLSDRLGVHGRSLVMFVGLGATTVSLLILMSLRADAAVAWLPIVVIGIIAFCLLGPYSYLGGAFALDFGGKQASAVSSGIIDGVGYLGGVLAGDSVARISVSYGWRGVFVALAGVTALATLAAGWLFVVSIRTSESLQVQSPPGGA
ncbi:MAG TPA: MFS transporter [Steroidobacteraceae bacterium]|jgi:OPA family glycerol-3-phosphate transporter-like MFS transporter